MNRIISSSTSYHSLLTRAYVFFQTVSYSIALFIVVAFLITCRNYNNEVYTMETDYLHWVTRVPAFSVCPAPNGRYVAQQLSRISKISSVTPQNVSFFVNILRPGKIMCPQCPVTWPTNLSKNLTYVSDILTPHCETQFMDCFWNGKPFSCCQHFHPLLTKHGLCYSLNSEQTGGSDHEPFDMVTSFNKPEAKLEIVTHASFAFYISDRKSVIMKKPRFFIPLGQKGEVYFKFTETVALDSASELKSSQRSCIMDGDIEMPGFKKYSHSVCRIDCLAKKQLELCGCRHHLLIGDGDTCGVTGLECLDRYSRNLTKLKCGCKHECVGQEVKFVHFSMSGDSYGKASINVTLTKPPTERVIFYAEITLVETIVGFACMTRLITTTNLHESIIALWALVKNYAKIIAFIYQKIRNIV